jgi:3-hydroxyisobutyrate dehydrogenase-like beta-hydroxyacid dehydrogenase
MPNVSIEIGQRYGTPTAHVMEGAMKVGVVGLGRMGSAIWQRLASQGFELSGWDCSAEAMRKNAAEGLRLLDSPRSVAGEADFIISIITEDSGVRSIYTGSAGFLQTEINRKVFVEMSTLRPMTVRELAPLVERKGGRMIDAPVLGTIPSVRDGKLFVMAGGRAEDIDSARPVLEKLARRISHMGPLGSGHAMKLAANIGLGTYVQAIAESLALGQREGLRLEQMVEVLGEAATASLWLKAKAQTLCGEDGDLTLDIRTMRKDIMSAVATAALSGVATPSASGTLASLSAAVAHGHGDEDIAELPKFFRQHMGQAFS